MLLNKSFVCTGLRPVRKPALLHHPGYTCLGKMEGAIHPSACSSLSFSSFPGHPCCSRWASLALWCPAAPACDIVQHLWRCRGYPEVIYGGRFIWWLLFSPSPFRRGWIIWGLGHPQCHRPDPHPGEVKELWLPVWWQQLSKILLSAFPLAQLLACANATSLLFV